MGRLLTEREKEVLPLESGCQSSANDTEKTSAAWERVRSPVCYDYFF